MVLRCHGSKIDTRSTVATGRIEGIEGRVEVVHADGSADNTPGQGAVVYAEDAIFDNIAVHLTDTDGDFDDSTLTMKVIDDVPQLRFIVMETGSVLSSSLN
jgi:hypothetical protein